MYYRIRELDPEVIGLKDGLVQAELVKKRFLDKKKYEHYFNYFLSYNIESLTNYTKLPLVDFDFEYVKVQPNIILTDFLCFGPSFYHRFLISKKVQDILIKYRLPPYKFYNAKLFIRDEIVDEYKYLFCPSFSYEFIDFNRSVFSMGNNKSDKEFIKLTSENELIASNVPLNREKIVIKSNFDKTLDFFNLLISPDPIISERLYNEFLRNEVTGIEMFELNKSQFEIL